jgi:hypothetical protein
MRNLAFALFFLWLSDASAAPGLPKALMVTTNSRAVLLPLGATTLSNSPSFISGVITLAWDRSPDTNVTGYGIYYGGISGIYTGSYSLGNVDWATLGGLKSGTNYFFAATARASSGESAFSNEASGVPHLASVGTPPVCSLRHYIDLFECTLFVGRTNSIQTSSNLINWVTIKKFIGTNGVFSMMATNNKPTQYFRVKVD